MNVCSAGVGVLMMTSLLVRSMHLDQEPSDGVLRCNHHSCQFIGSNETNPFYNYYYDIEGNIIKITQLNYDGLGLALKIFCYGANVLESPALPRAQQTLLAWIIELSSCPLPSASSLADVLDAFNIGYYDWNLSTPRLVFSNLPLVPPLDAKHFDGLSLLVLRVLSETGVSPKPGFLKPLTSLYDLAIYNAILPTGELDILPPSLINLELHNTSLERLPKAIYSSTHLKKLTVEDDSSLDAVVVPPAVVELVLQSPATKLKLKSAPALKTLRLHNWIEPLPPPIRHCNVLREIYLKAPAMRALPDGWLTQCRGVTELVIENAYNLTTLPSMHFLGPPIKRFAVRQSALESLPTNLLDNLNQVESLELDGNYLHAVPRFSKLFAMSKLNVSHNNLDGSVLAELSQLPRNDKALLAELDLSYNPLIGDVCDTHGYSLIRNVTNLQKLFLRGTGVSRICKDWRQEMPRLELLDLSNTNISELWYEDLLYRRNVTSQVLLRGAPITAVQMTREDYKMATTALPSFTSVDIRTEFECDCRLYWARRALDHPLAQHTVPGIRELRCIGVGLMREIPPEKMFCSAREDCAAVKLPPGSECEARPDDDPDEDRWLVRMRCDNSTLGLVPRRVYPFYPMYLSNNQGAYLAKCIKSISLN